MSLATVRTKRLGERNLEAALAKAKNRPYDANSFVVVLKNKNTKVMTREQILAQVPAYNNEVLSIDHIDPLGGNAIEHMSLAPVVSGFDAKGQAVIRWEFHGGARGAEDRILINFNDKKFGLMGLEDIRKNYFNIYNAGGRTGEVTAVKITPAGEVIKTITKRLYLSADPREAEVVEDHKIYAFEKYAAGDRTPVGAVVDRGTVIINGKKINILERSVGGSFKRAFGIIADTTGGVAALDVGHEYINFTPFHFDKGQPRDGVATVVFGKKDEARPVYSFGRDYKLIKQVGVVYGRGRGLINGRVYEAAEGYNYPNTREFAGIWMLSEDQKSRIEYTPMEDSQIRVVVTDNTTASRSVKTGYITHRDRAALQAFRLDWNNINKGVVWQTFAEIRRGQDGLDIQKVYAADVNGNPDRTRLVGTGRQGYRGDFTYVTGKGDTRVAQVMYDGHLQATSFRKDLGQGRQSLPLIQYYSTDSLTSIPIYKNYGVNGDFAEFNELRRNGHTLVFGVTSGFETATIEVFNSHGGKSEAMIYGHEAATIFPYSDSPTADLDSRVYTNIFNLVNRYAFFQGRDPYFGGSVARSNNDPVLKALYTGEGQRRRSQELPVAAPVMAQREPGLTVGAATLEALPETLLEGIRMNFVPYSGNHGSGLFLTHPRTARHDYASTEDEALIIRALTCQGQYADAARALRYYYILTNGGQDPVYAWYHVDSGMPQELIPGFKSARPSSRTAAAQIALARAAYEYFLATGDRHAHDMTGNLLEPLRNKYLVQGGLIERVAPETEDHNGITFWAEAKKLYTTDNANAYVLCDRIARTARGDDKLRAVSLELRASVGAWLNSNILPRFQREGVVITGTHEIQIVTKDKDDANSLVKKGNVYAENLHTTTSATLAFIRAQAAMGADQGLLFKGMDRATAMFGVRANGVWGMDWTLPRGEVDMASSRMTAEYRDVARSIGYHAGEAAAVNGLNRMQNHGGYIEVATPQDSLFSVKDVDVNGLRTADGSYVLVPHDKSGWAYSPAAAAQVLMDAAPVARAQQVMPINAQVEHDAANDVKKFWWGFAYVLAGLIGLNLISWSLIWPIWKRRLDNARKEGKVVVSLAIMEAAEERWAKNILFTNFMATAQQTCDGVIRSSDGPVDENFSGNLRAIYKLGLAWRAAKAGWSEAELHDKLMSGDAFLNGLDELMLIHAFLARRVVFESKKDSVGSFESKKNSAGSMDSNHGWSRMEQYAEYYRSAITRLMDEKQKIVVAGGNASGVAEKDRIIAQLFGQFGLQPRGSPAITTPDDLVFIQEILQNYVTPGAHLQRLETIVGAVNVQAPLNGGHHEIVGNTTENVIAVLANVMAVNGAADVKKDHIGKIQNGLKDFFKREYFEIIPKWYIFIDIAKVLPQLVGVLIAMVAGYQQFVGGVSIFTFLGALPAVLVAMPVIQLALAFVGVGVVLRVAVSALAKTQYKGYLNVDETAARILKGFHHASHILRGIGFVLIGAGLSMVPVHGLGQWFMTHGLMWLVAGTEAAGVFLPYLFTLYSRVTQTWINYQERTGNNRFSGLAKFLNLLNIPESRPMSIVGDSLIRHLQPSVPTGRAMDLFKAIVNYAVLSGLFMWLGGFVMGQAAMVNWISDVYLTSGVVWQLGAGSFVLALALYMTRYAISNVINSVASAFVTWPMKTLGLAYVVAAAVTGILHMPFVLPVNGMVVAILIAASLLDKKIITLLMARNDARIEKAYIDNVAAHEKAHGVKKLFTLVFAGGDAVGTLGRLGGQIVIDRWNWFKDRSSHGIDVMAEVDDLVGTAGDEKVKEWITELHQVETTFKVTLWHPVQILIDAQKAGTQQADVANDNIWLYARDEAQKDRLIRTWKLRRFLVSMQSSGGHSQDTGITIMDIALALKEKLAGVDIGMILLSNKYEDGNKNPSAENYQWNDDKGQRVKLLRLVKTLTGIEGNVVHDWTAFANKAAAMTGTDMVHEWVSRQDTFLIMDRNATVHNMDDFVLDVKTSLADDSLVIVVPSRGTTNIKSPHGESSQSIEEGHRAYVKGVMAIGGAAGESVGTGWGNILKNTYWRAQTALMNPQYPTMPLSIRSRTLRRGFWDNYFSGLFGLVGFIPSAVGISEDIWAVQQQAHTVIGLGGTPRFAQSKAFWHKIRETYAQHEWMAAFPRWSGGFPQLMMDKMMQKIQDYGPQSIFAKEIRDNGGRFFLTAPHGILFILLIPIAIKFGFLPFIGVNLVFAILGGMFNQVLTFNGLIAYLEAHEFYTKTAVVFALVAAAIVGIFGGDPVSVYLAFLAGGFIIGLSRWLSNRPRDFLLFATQQMIHLLGQAARQSLKFTLSGADAEDSISVEMRKHVTRKYENFINMKVIWGFGLLLFGLNLWALSGLDMLNVILLLPSLLFNLGLVIGMFVMKTPEGHFAGNAKQWGSRLAGWGVAGVLYSGLSSLVLLGGTWGAMAAYTVLVFGVGLTLLTWVLMYYPKAIVEQIHHPKTGAMRRAENNRVQGHSGAEKQIEGLNKKAGKLNNFHAGLIKYFPPAMLANMFDAHMTKLKKDKKMQEARLYSEFLRSFVVALFGMIWFFIVPIPGFLAFDTLAARISIPLGNLLWIVGGTVVTFVLARVAFKVSSAISSRYAKERLVELHKYYELIEKDPGIFAAPEAVGQKMRFVSHVRALLADTFIYVEQGSDGYAHKSMDVIEKALKNIQGRAAAPAPFVPSTATRELYNDQVPPLNYTATAGVDNRVRAIDAQGQTLNKARDEVLRDLYAAVPYLSQAPPCAVVVTSDFARTADSIAAYNPAEKTLYVHLSNLDRLVELTGEDKAAYLLFLQGVVEGHEKFHVEGADEPVAMARQLLYLRAHPAIEEATRKVLARPEVFGVQAVDGFDRMLAGSDPSAVNFGYKQILTDKLLEDGAQVGDQLARNHLNLARPQWSIFHNIPLGGQEAARDVVDRVQQVIADKLADTDRGKAIYQALAKIHTTVANFMIGPRPIMERQEFMSGLEEDARGVTPFAYQVVGPRLMPDLSVVLELKSASDNPTLLRGRMAARFTGDLPEGYRRFVPDINHISVAYLKEGDVEQLRELNAAFAVMRQELAGSPVFVTASRVNVSTTVKKIIPDEALMGVELAQVSAESIAALDPQESNLGSPAWIKVTTAGLRGIVPEQRTDVLTIPKGRVLAERLMRGELQDEEIDTLSVDVLADVLRLIPLDKFFLQEKMLVYSGPPGVGKGAIMASAFKGDKALYRDFVERLALYHTRHPRAGEVDGEQYHFGFHNLGVADKNRLLTLATQGKIDLVRVNKQLQGMAKEDFEETVTLHMKDAPIETVLEGDKDVDLSDENIKVVRPIKGLASAFGSKKLTVLEGGYSWFRTLSDAYGKMYTIFITPFTSHQISLRAVNQRVIAEIFISPFERFLGYSLTNMMRREMHKEEIDLRDLRLRGELQRRVWEWERKYAGARGTKIEKEAVMALGRNSADKIKALAANAALIESDLFIEQVDHLVVDYFKRPSFRVNGDVVDSVRAMAYEMQMRLVRNEDRGDISFELQVASRKKEQTGDFNKPEDMLNRVIEGVVQIMLMNEYVREGRGALVVYPFVWEKNGGFKERVRQQAVEEISQKYFSYLLKALASSEAQRVSGLNVGVNVLPELTGLTDANNLAREIETFLLPDIKERKQTHVMLVNERIKMLASRDWQRLYDGLSSVIKGKVSLEEYGVECEKFFYVYQNLSPRARDILIAGAAAHDAGVRYGIREWDHYGEGANIIAGELRKRGYHESVVTAMTFLCGIMELSIISGEIIYITTCSNSRASGWIYFS